MINRCPKYLFRSSCCFFVYIYQQNWFLRPCTVCLSNHKSILNYSRSLFVTTKMTTMLTVDRFVLRVSSLVQATFQDGYNQLLIHGLISLNFVRDVWRFSTGVKVFKTACLKLNLIIVIIAKVMKPQLISSY